MDAAPAVDVPGDAPTQPVDAPVADDAPARCPFPHGASSTATVDDAACPIKASPAPADLSPADRFMRRILFVRDAPEDLSDARVYKSFQRSMLISAVRCTLTYVVFPIASSGLSFVHGFGPVFGILIGLFALGCDTFTVRRFFVANHRYRWYFTAIAGCVMALLTVLLVQDIAHLVTGSA